MDTHNPATRLSPRAEATLLKVAELIIDPPPGKGFNMRTYSGTLGTRFAFEDGRGGMILVDRSPARQTCGTCHCIYGWVLELQALGYDVVTTRELEQETAIPPVEGGFSGSGFLWLGHPPVDGPWSEWNTITAEEAVAAIQRLIENPKSNPWAVPRENAPRA
jgi:hypothetical protein